MNLKNEIDKLSESALSSNLSFEDRIELFNQLSDLAMKISNLKHPVLNVKLIKSSSIKENDYNPNFLAPPEYHCLSHSIEKDGLTMPVVVAKSQGKNLYTIIDGSKRTKLIKSEAELNNSTSNYVPVVVLDNSLDERIASSVRHNTARGSQQVKLTSELILRLKKMNWSNDDISRELGMEYDEILRLQQITGLASAFKNEEFSTAWE